MGPALWYACNTFRLVSSAKCNDAISWQVQSLDDAPVDAELGPWLGGDVANAFGSGEEAKHLQLRPLRKGLHAWLHEHGEVGARLRKVG